MISICRESRLKKIALEKAKAKYQAQLRLAKMHASYRLLRSSFHSWRGYICGQQLKWIKASNWHSEIIQRSTFDRWSEFKAIMIASERLREEARLHEAKVHYQIVLARRIFAAIIAHQSSTAHKYHAIQVQCSHFHRLEFFHLWQEILSSKQADNEWIVNHVGAKRSSRIMKKAISHWHSQLSKWRKKRELAEERQNALLQARKWMEEMKDDDTGS